VYSDFSFYFNKIESLTADTIQVQIEHCNAGNATQYCGIR